MKKCKVCNKEIKGVRKLFVTTKYCLECSLAVSNSKRGGHYPRRKCVVCKKPSFGKKHSGCEFQSLRGSRSSVSKLLSNRRNELSKKSNLNEKLIKGNGVYS